MISIIVCSIKPDLLRSFKANVLETIGVPHEFIIIDNNKEQFSICKAYNVGAEKAKYDVLAFCHEDILFHTNNWGEELIKTLRDTSIGAVGAAGVKIKPCVPASWTSVSDKYYRTNLIKNSDNKKIKSIKKDNVAEKLSDIAIADGMFLVTTKTIWENNKFDEINFDGFHFYDQDFSMQIIKNYRIVINHEILVEHLSEGNLNKSWLKYSDVFFNKWKQDMPVITYVLTTNEINQCTYDACYSYVFNSYRLGSKSVFVLQFIFKMFFLNPFNRKTISAMKYFFK
ncbi:glycosyltransferase [Formosa sp. PL04]|uniref:glycosyltransferase n=1 Tax=Formosa sp. PL04 TaxID=3081755 RepID=UPI002981DFB2|nr:glycosyltransferase [Formosa sp. PL04]MDW5287877.1 glycosyltransferase [Formosa sp. PL04]